VNYGQQQQQQQTSEGLGFSRAPFQTYSMETLLYEGLAPTMDDNTFSLVSKESQHNLGYHPLSKKELEEA